MNTSEIVLLKLSLQKALLGEVTPNLFGVTAGIEGNLIRVHAYFSQGVSEEEIEDIQCVTTEVISDFPDRFMIEENSFSLLEHPLEPLDFWVFLRRKADIG